MGGWTLLPLDLLFYILFPLPGTNDAQLQEQQKQEEDRRAMEVISWLGENGFLASASASAANGAPHAPAPGDA